MMFLFIGVCCCTAARRRVGLAGCVCCRGLWAVAVRYTVFFFFNIDYRISFHKSCWESWCSTISLHVWRNPDFFLVPWARQEQNSAGVRWIVADKRRWLGSLGRGSRPLWFPVGDLGYTCRQLGNRFGGARKCRSITKAGASHAKPDCNSGRGLASERVKIHRRIAQSGIGTTHGGA